MAGVPDGEPAPWCDAAAVAEEVASCAIGFVGVGATYAPEAIITLTWN